VCTAESIEASKANLKRAPAWQQIFLALRPLLAKVGQVVAKNVEKPILGADGQPLDGLYVVDSITPEQGPNYILAKRLQHWRGMLSRESGCIVSSNVGPITATASVLSNLLFAVAMKGMASFHAIEVEYQETSNTVLAALLIRDLRDETSASHPSTKLRNPLCLVAEQPFHSGCWRGAWKFQSYGVMAMISFFLYAFVVSPYLFCYNLYQAQGWGRLLIGILTAGSSSGLWDAMGANVAFFQHLGLMEVVHSAAGMTRSSVALTFVQIMSRVGVIALLNGCSGVKSNGTWVWMMLLCWSAADCLRYVFYCFTLGRELAGYCKSIGVSMKLVKVKNVEVADDPVFKIPYPLVWLRYSLFIVNYPTGVFCELVVWWLSRSCLMSAMSTAQPGTLSHWTLQTLKFLLGAIGVAQSETALYAVILFVYILGLPVLFLSLLGSRKKQLARPPKAEKSSDKKSK
jgi:hypothetical protein